MGKAIAVRIAAVKLLYRNHVEPGDFVGSAGFQSDELDRRRKRMKIYRKPGGRMLRTQRITQLAVASVNANMIARNVSRGKKREPHDVVPVRMGQKNIEDVLAAGAVLTEQ